MPSWQFLWTEKVGRGFVIKAKSRKEACEIFRKRVHNGSHYKPCIMPYGSGPIGDGRFIGGGTYDKDGVYELT